MLRRVDGSGLSVFFFCVPEAITGHAWYIGSFFDVSFEVFKVLGYDHGKGFFFSVLGGEENDGFRTRYLMP